MDTRWDQLSQTAWQGQLAAQPYGLRQDWAFGLAMARLGVKVGRAVVFDGAQAVAVAQVLQRRGLRLIGQGPVWLRPLEPAQKRCIIRHLARHCGASIVTAPEPLAGFGMVPVITGKASAVWNIGLSPVALRQGLHGKWRNRLLRVESSVKPTQLRGQTLGALVTQEAATRLKRGYTNLPGGLAVNWLGDSLTLGWHSGGMLQAGMVFLVHGTTASYFLGWSSEAGRAAFAHGPILWQAALTLRSRGVVQLDLGDVNTQTGAGLARFKLGTGAGVVTAGATCLILP